MGEKLPGVIVVTDHRFCMAGADLYSSARYDETFLRRYVHAFGDVMVLGRGGGKPVRLAGRHPFVEVPPLPQLLNPLMLVRFWWRFHRAADERWIVVRLPSFVGTALLPILLLKRRRLIVEVVGSPQALLAVGYVNLRLRLLGRIQRRAQRLLCRSASGVSYVDRRLMAESPPGKHAEVDVYSSVELGAEWMRPAREDRRSPGDAVDIVSVVSLAHPYKGLGTLLDALAQLRGQFPFRLTVFGDGPNRAEFQEHARILGLGDAVRFAGYVGDRELREALDRADVYVHPSWTEGLPRAVIEAATRSRMSIATDVGGTASLVEDDLLVPPRDAQALAAALRRVATFGAHEREQRESRARARVERFSPGSQQAVAVEFYVRVTREQEAL